MFEVFTKASKTRDGSGVEFFFVLHTWVWLLKESCQFEVTRGISTRKTSEFLFSYVKQKFWDDFGLPNNGLLGWPKYPLVGPYFCSDFD